MRSTLSIWLICLLHIFIFNTGYCQMLDSATLQAQPVYDDLHKALQEPEKVYRLNLSKQKLSIFPEEIIQFKNLQELNLSKNRIDSLPEKICTLAYLQILNVSGNKLKYLPDSIGSLKHLKKLQASRNNLLEIPTQIGELSNLEVLDLWENDIGIFPDELGKLKKLRWMDLRVILIDDAMQQRIQRLLPEVKIFFSPSCHCVTG